MVSELMMVKDEGIGSHGLRLLSRIIEALVDDFVWRRYLPIKMRTFFCRANQDGTACKHVPVGMCFFCFYAKRSGAYVTCKHMFYAIHEKEVLL